MGKKQTKRSRKFVARGGAKASLKKGSVTNQVTSKRASSSKNRSKSSGTADGPSSTATQYMEEKLKKREDADLLSEKNLGDLDMASFFDTFTCDVGNNTTEHDQPSKGDCEEDENEDGHDSNTKEEMVEDKLNDEEKHEPRRKKPKCENAIRKISINCSDSEEDSNDEDVVVRAELQMKDELKKLQTKDPEFHKFLKQNEESLLRYDSEEASKIDDEDNTNHEKVNEEKNDNQSATGTLLTSSLLDKLEKAAFEAHGIKALRKIVNAFKSACRLSDGNDETNPEGKEFSLGSSDIFDRLMVLSLSKCQNEFHYHLLGLNNDKCNGMFDHDKPISPKILERSERWSSLMPIIFSFLKSAIYILSEAKESELIVFVLKTLSGYAPFLTPFPRLSESFLKVLTSLWSAPIDSSENYQVVRLHSFLRIRQLALTQPFPFIDECLKKSYLAYAQRAKFATNSSVTATLPTLTFMGNCVVELYSLDYHSSYQHAFIYIRQLALHLRTATQKKSTDAVYCWQYMHCLKLWVAVITEACQSSSDENCKGPLSNRGEDQLLRSLIFPLTQVILGTARLVPSARYVPLRLHCVRLVQQIAAASDTFLPSTSILMDILDLPELYQLPKKLQGANVQPIGLTLKLRADHPLRSMEELEMCVSEVFVLLNREMGLYQYTAGFPEFAVRISQRLRKFSKEARHASWRAYSIGSLDLCQKHSSWAMKERVNPQNKKMSDLSPKDIKQLEVLKPVSRSSMGERHKISLEKESRLELASPSMKRKASTKDKVVDEDVSENDSSKRGNKKKQNTRGTAPTHEHDEANTDVSTLDQEDMVEDLDWSNNE